MSGPPAKKQKVAEPPPAPIIFKAAGMKCDTRLLVFRQEFQVHSMLLKLHSAFFRKFMDSAEKKDNLPQDGFEYNWTTLVDEDGTDWHLVSNNDYKNPAPYDKYEGSIDAERDLFETLLCAFYTKPYTIACINELSDLTKLTDYYCCLRVLPNTANGAILTNGSKDKWYADIEEYPFRVLEIAMKLRNSMLSKDALIFAVSFWEYPSYKSQGHDWELRHIADHAYGKIAVLVSEAYQICIQEWADSGVLSECAQEFGRFYGSEWVVPQYFRLIREHKEVESHDDMDEANAVLQCNLAFPIKTYKAGSGDYVGHFFCATISELPWDVNDEDW